MSASSTNTMPTIGGIKVSNSLKAATTSSSKRHNLTSQMREKAFGRLGQAATTLSAAPPQNVAPQQPIYQATKSSESTSHTSPVASLKENTTPPPKQARSPVISPLDTYEMSDHGGSSDTDEEEEQSRRVGKRVPNWAHKENLEKSLLAILRRFLVGRKRNTRSGQVLATGPETVLQLPRSWHSNARWATRWKPKVHSRD